MRRFSWASLWLMVVGSASLLVAAPPPGKPLHTNKPRFRIPYHFDAKEMERLGAKEIRLYISTNQGASWQLSQSVPPQPGKFPFQAPQDGEYWFAVRTLDSKGKLHPADDKVQPGLQVIVDTQIPRLEINLGSRGPGRALLKWTAQDDALDLSSLRLEYIPASQRDWQPIGVVPKASDQTEWSVPQGGMISVRGRIADLAGNIATREARIQIPPGNGGPAFSQPDFKDPVANQGNLPGQATAGVLPRLPDMDQHPVPDPLANLPRESFVPARVPGSFVSSEQNANHRWNSNGNNPPAFSGGNTIPATSLAPNQRLVNHRQFHIGYRVEEVGPSGLGAVELFITQDNGATWFRYGEDPDRQSPFVVSVPREGTYGFTIVPRSGVGLAVDPPQPGDRPSMTVVIDETPPQVQLMPVEQGRGADLNKVLIRWIAQDEHLGDRPVSLSSAPTPQGPWSTIAAGLDNSGRYIWSMPAGTSPRLFFRVEVRDIAGNVQRMETNEPSLIDLFRPTARILEIETPQTADSMPDFSPNQ